LVTGQMAATVGGGATVGGMVVGGTAVGGIDVGGMVVGGMAVGVNGTDVAEGRLVTVD